METNPKTNKISLKINRKNFYKQLNSFVLLLSFFLCSNWVVAQRIINYNDERAAVIPVYDISISTSTGGSISVSSTSSNDGANVPAGEKVTVTFTSDLGYELKYKGAFKTDDELTEIPLDDTDGEFSFEMPDFDVTVWAIFDYNEDQQTVLDAKTIIDLYADFTFDQADVYDETTLKDALVAAINILLSDNDINYSISSDDVTLESENYAVAGTESDISGTDGDFSFTVKLIISSTTTEEITDIKYGVITATPYTVPLNYLVTIAPSSFGTVEADVTDPVVENTLITLTITPDEGYELDEINAFNSDDENETVALNGSGDTRTFNMPAHHVTVEATFKETDDQLDVKEAIRLINGMSDVSVLQSVANTEEDVKTVLAQIINALEGMNETGIIVTVDDIEISEFNPATEGTDINPAGINGDFDFTVTLKKTNSASITSDEKSGEIIATEYDDPMQDDDYIAAAKLAIESATYMDWQLFIPTEAQAKLKVEAIISGIDLKGVTAEVVGISFTGAVAGTVGDLNGINGNYKFKVKLNKGIGEEVFTEELTLTIIANPYDSTLDNADISIVKALIQGQIFTTTQANAPDEPRAKAVVESKLTTLNLNYVITTVNGGVFTPAIAGTEDNQTGTDGSYTFTVSLNKGGGTEQTTNLLTLIITATPYIPPSTHIVTVAPTLYGTVVANITVPVVENTSITLTVTPNEGYELEEIRAYDSDNINKSVELTGSGNTRTFNMPAHHVTVEAKFKKTTAQKEVENAIDLINRLSNFFVLQKIANTEETVKTWLVQQINAIPGMSATNIVVNVENITINDFTAALAGTSTNTYGTNGTFSFFITLKKDGSATEKSSVKNGLIIATDYITSLYYIMVFNTINGVVNSNRDNAEAGETITLTIVPDQGFELETLTSDPLVFFSGSGNTRTFVMPSNDVLIRATFKKTQARLDAEALEAVKLAIEIGTYKIAQETGNTPDAVKTWLLNTLGVMFGDKNKFQFRSSDDPVIGDVTITAFIPAVEGTVEKPTGTNGAFLFRVDLKLGSAALTTIATSGTIIALPFRETPLKKIELLKSSELAVRILNTGNVETGVLKLELTGENPNAFLLPVATIYSLAVGRETEIVLTMRSGLSDGVYKANFVVSGENLAATSVEINYTITSTGVENLQINSLSAWLQNDLLNVSGLKAGQSWTVYNASGIIIYRGIAVNEEAKINLPTRRGVYIVSSGKDVVKIVY